MIEYLFESKNVYWENIEFGHDQALVFVMQSTMTYLNIRWMQTNVYGCLIGMNEYNSK